MFWGHGREWWSFAALIGALVLSIATAIFSRLISKKLTPKQRWFYFITTVSLILTGVSIFKVEESGPTIFAFLNSSFASGTIALILATVAGGAGFIAFAFKLFNKWLFGAVEVVFGVVSAYTISLTIMPGKLVLSQWTSLAACAYIVARGLTNAYEASEKKHAPEIITRYLLELRLEAFQRQFGLRPLKKPPVRKRRDEDETADPPRTSLWSSIRKFI